MQLINAGILAGSQSFLYLTYRKDSELRDLYQWRLYNSAINTFREISYDILLRVKPDSRFS